MPEVAMFVYGTLRPHDDIGWNRGRSSEGGEDRPPILNCTVPGDIYDNGYPLAKFCFQAPGDPPCDGKIVGDVIFLEQDSDEYRRIEQMERGAGYKLVNVLVSISGDNDDENDPHTQMGAVAWHYDREIDPEWNKLIVGGDFRKFHQHR